MSTILRYLFCYDFQAPYEPPPKPFHFKYEAGRVPGGGGRPDRYVEQEGDGTGQIRGSYTYLDPNWTWQTVSNNNCL